MMAVCISNQRVENKVAGKLTQVFLAPTPADFQNRLPNPFKRMVARVASLVQVVTQHSARNNLVAMHQHISWGAYIQGNRAPQTLELRQLYPGARQLNQCCHFVGDLLRQVLNVFFLLAWLLEKPVPISKFRWQLTPNLVLTAHRFVLEDHRLRNLKNGERFERHD